MVQNIDQRAQAEHVTEENELLADVAACLSGLGQKLDGSSTVRVCDVSCGPRPFFVLTHFHSSVVSATSLAKA
jgi:hypothetical protein